MEHKLEPIFNVFLVGIVRELVIATGIEEEKAIEIVKKVAGNIDIELPQKKKKEEKPVCEGCNKHKIVKLSKSGKYCEKCARERDDYRDVTICDYHQGKKKCQAKAYASQYCKKHEPIMEEVASGKRCLATIKSSGAKNGGPCHQLVEEGSTFCKAHERNGHEQCCATKKDGARCANKATKNGRCGQHAKKAEKENDVEVEE
jgi:Family of unknown function (DUF5763)